MNGFYLQLMARRSRSKTFQQRAKVVDKVGCAGPRCLVEARSSHDPCCFLKDCGKTSERKSAKDDVSHINAAGEEDRSTA